jgi:hypothetical protein
MPALFVLEWRTVQLAFRVSGISSVFAGGFEFGFVTSATAGSSSMDARGCLLAASQPYIAGPSCWGAMHSSSDLGPLMARHPVFWCAS